MYVPFIADENAHKQQAGPNGPENNCDLNYAISDDAGETWRSTKGDVMAKLGRKDGKVAATISNDTEGARVFEIPTGSGILNQEGQAADWEGGFWVLNRENVDMIETLMVYYRDPKGALTAFRGLTTNELNSTRNLVKETHQNDFSANSDGIPR